jgi:hypothetical protein
LGEQGNKGQLMDVTRIIAELRSERQEIERAILSLERFDRRSNGATKETPRYVTDIRRVMEPDGGLKRASAHVLDAPMSS